MFDRQSLDRNRFMLTGSFSRKGYDWWWHSFTAVNSETGEERPFFIEFFTVNPALGGKDPIFGQLPENKAKGIRPSYLMVKAGTWLPGGGQLHRFFGWDDVKISYGEPFSVEAGDCYLTENETRGSIEILREEAKEHPEWMCDAGSIFWDLKIVKKTAYNVGYGASPFFRGIKAFEMYWHAQGIKSLYTGTITYNGIKYDVIPDKSYGYADKNWGRGFTSPWVWLSSCNLSSNLTGKKLENSVFEIGGGRPKIYFIPLNRKLLGGFYYEGEEFEFNFSKFWTGSKTKFSYEETEEEIIWHVRQECHKGALETEARCFKKDMLLVNYEAPDGSKRHNRLWNGGNGTANLKLYRRKSGKLELIDDITARNLGCEYGEYDS